MRPIVSSFALLAALTFGACESATAPEPMAAPPGPTLVSANRNADVLGAPPEVVRAEFSEGFCFFVVMDGGANGYSGASTAVTTPSGNTNYRCVGNLLFGEGISGTMNLRDVVFSFDFFAGDMEPCHVVVTPGANGQASVTCHMRD